MKAKEFLGRHEIEHRSYNALDDGQGTAFHVRIGAPPVPSLVVGTKAYPILHTAQIISVLGLALPPGADVPTARLAYDCITILESWLELLDRIDFEDMTAPTPVRSRSTRSFTTEMFNLFALIPGAWADGTLEWHTRESNLALGETLGDAQAVRDFARRRLTAFQSFVLDTEDAFEDDDPWVETTARGDMPFSVLMDSQRTHVAVHQRQIVTFLQDRGVDTAGILSVDGMADLDLPESID